VRPREFFNDNVSDDIQGEIVRTFYRAYPDTKNDLDEMEYPLDYFKDLYGQLLRAKVDIYLRQLSKRFPEQVEAITSLNKAKNSHHALVISDKIMMTASAVQFETALPREAIFREELAEQTQGEFIYDEEKNIYTLPTLSEHKPSLDSKIYAIILHGPAENNRYLPGFIKVAFLDCKMNRLCDDLNLSNKYRNIVDEMLTIDTEKISETMKFELSKESSPAQERR